MPRVSICIPTYNSERFLGAAIESALSQTFLDFELIISDNASTDGTPALCQRYADPRIRYHRFETLVGQGGNWNRCLRLATGDLVALLHADDVYLPDFLATRVRQFETDSSVGLAFGAVELIDVDGKVVGTQSFQDREMLASPAEFWNELLQGCVVNPASLVIKRSCYGAVGEFNEDRLWAIDWDMWLRVAAIGGVSYTPRISSQYRVHGASGSSTGLLGIRYLSDDFAVLKGALQADTRLPERTRDQRRRKALKAYSLRAMNAAGANCDAGRRGDTLGALREALRFSPGLVFKPTTWALVAGALAGPPVYRWWNAKRTRGSRRHPSF